MRSTSINRKRWPVSEEALARLLHEYRRLREEHRRARAAGRTRRKLDARLRHVRDRFERQLAEAPLGSGERRRWRDALAQPVATPAVHASPRRVLFRGRSDAGSELLLVPTPDGAVEALVDGAATEILDRTDELETTRAGLVFALEGTPFHETFAVPRRVLAELRDAVERGRTPRPEHLRELLADGLVDGTLGLTARGRRALDLDRRPARRHGEVAATEISVRGPVSRRARDELAGTLTRVAQDVPRPVLHVGGSLTRARDPAVERPVLATATVDLGRRVVRARAVAATEHEAIDLLADRLRRRLRRPARLSPGSR